MRCRQCGKDWSGLKMCHCSRCHRTFSTLAVFDAHQPASTGWDCQDPAKNKFVTDDRGIWKYPKTARYTESETVSTSGGTS